MPENPFRAPSESTDAVTESPTPVSSGQAAYNVVTDTVTGVNVRWSDNRFQAVFVASSVVLLAALGALLAAINPRWNLPWYGGGLVGMFAGLVFGVFTSGIFLMFYRATRHFRGKHD
ncbi:MAG: hypothetical protein U0905_21395 [Pirellulales bacterium]